MDDSKLNPENDGDKETEAFYDAADEFPFYETPSPSSKSSINGPRLRRRSISHRFQDESTTASGKDSDPKSSLSFSYDRNQKVHAKIELLAENENSDFSVGHISSNIISNNNSVNTELKDDSVLNSEDPYTNSLMVFDRTESEEKKKRFIKKLEELGDKNDYFEESDNNYNIKTEVKEDLAGCSRDNYDLPSGEINSNSVTNCVNTEIEGFIYTASEERKKRFVKKREELETRKRFEDENRVNVAENCANDDELVINEASSGFLFVLAGFVIKALGLQLSLLISCITFPVRFLYCTYMFVVDPFRVSRSGAEYTRARFFKIVNFVCEKFVSFADKWFKEHKSIWQLVLRFSWGFLWATYVCIVLVTLLISAFVLSGVIMRKLVDEPIQIKESLSLDYTKNSPVAFVPIILCPNEAHDLSFAGKIDVGNTGLPRVIPRNHKFQATVSLMLPESDYNRYLGIFQVRVDLLSANGRTLASSRRPCMLHFKSQPIRMLLTLFKIAPLVTGYSSESQTLNIDLRGFTEGDIPTACLRVMIEPRAEFRPGAGIPEIYDASLTLESQLPLLKKMMWRWKKSLFVWVGLSLFVMLILFALVCCRPLILPRGRASNISPQR